MNEHELVTVAEFTREYEAYFAKARLAADDIEAFVHNSHFAGLTSDFLSAQKGLGVLVRVRRRDLASAREILSLESEIPDDTGWGSCPACGSRKLELRLERNRWSDLGLALFGGPLSFLEMLGLFRKRTLKCLACSVES